MPVIDSIPYPAPPHPQTGALPLQGLTLLLVEDSRYAADLLRLMLLRGGARLRRTESLQEARRHLSLYRPDAVLVDLGLPDGSGLSLIADLASAPTGGPALFAISGDPDLRDAAFAAGAVDFFEKPICGDDDFIDRLLAPLPRRALPQWLQTAPIPADPLALEEDLRFAQRLLLRSPPTSDRGYLAGFLTGLAQVSADQALARAASAFHKGDEGAGQRLAGLLAQRLAQPLSAFGGLSH